MGKIFKLMKGEMKKMFSGVGIFIMSAFLIFVLTICPKIFTPAEKSDISSDVTFSTTTARTTYESFLVYKTEYDSQLTTLKNSIDNYISHNADFKNELSSLNEEIYTLVRNFDTASSLGIIDGDDGCFVILNNLKTKVSQFENLYKSYFTDYSSPVILVDDTLDYDIKSEITSFSRTLNDNTDNSITTYRNINFALNDHGYVTLLRGYISRISNLSYSSENLNAIVDNYYTLKDEYKNLLSIEMSELYTQAGESNEVNVSANTINTILSDAFKYLSTTKSTVNVLSSNFMLAITSNLSDAEITNYLGYEEFNSYYHQENATKYAYLLSNNIVESDISNSFSFNVNSGSETTTFDYMYFALEIVSFLIIAFTVILGAGMIAKEYNEGTIKLLAIRPYSRSKIIMSKILATLLFAFIFVMVSAIVTFITGVIIYGLSFPTMLIVFNATTAFTLPVWVVMLIYLACLMIKVWVFSLIAIAISTIFKSYIMAVCLSAGIYLLNLIVTFIANGATWLKYNIFANLDLFKFFGGSFVKKASSSNITSLFSISVFADTNLWVSLITITALSVLLNILVFNVFKHRDIT